VIYLYHIHHVIYCIIQIICTYYYSIV